MKTLRELNAKALSGLLKQAKETSEWRGHELMPFFVSQSRERANSECTRCGRGVSINVHPMPNEIDIGGEALAVHCGSPRR